MKLRARGPRISIAAVPMADVALTLFAIVVCAGMFSAVRGVGVRFETTESGERPVPVVWVRVLADGTARVDGERVSPSAVAETVRRRLDAEPSLRCVVHIVPEATYQTAIDALARLTEGPNAVALAVGARLSIPTQREVEAFVAAAGYDPFESGTR
ncbi:MAG TPA: biopolymer transporter ExbD [Candidatus Polarisedimenticolaceae bacterium]